MKWVTRERPKTDRIACPWLIKNFIDAEAEFLYVPAEEVLEVAEREGAHSFDAPGASYECAPSRSATSSTCSEGTYRNSASGSMKFLISHGQAIRSVFGRSLVTHFI